MFPLQERMVVSTAEEICLQQRARDTLRRVMAQRGDLQRGQLGLTPLRDQLLGLLLA